MAGVYKGNWGSYEDMERDVSYGKGLPPAEDIVYANYDTPSYEGYALIVFKKDGKLYENNDSHCSCYGLEDWEPEATTVEALKMRKGHAGEGLSEALEGI